MAVIKTKKSYRTKSRSKSRSKSKSKTKSRSKFRSKSRSKSKSKSRQHFSKSKKNMKGGDDPKIFTLKPPTNFTNTFAKAQKARQAAEKTTPFAPKKKSTPNNSIPTAPPPRTPVAHIKQILRSKTAEPFTPLRFPLSQPEKFYTQPENATLPRPRPLELEPYEAPILPKKTEEPTYADPNKPLYEEPVPQGEYRSLGPDPYEKTTSKRPRSGTAPDDLHELRAKLQKTRPTSPHLIDITNSHYRTFRD